MTTVPLLALLLVFRPTRCLAAPLVRRYARRHGSTVERGAEAAWLKHRMRTRGGREYTLTTHTLTVGKPQRPRPTLTLVPGGRDDAE